MHANPILCDFSQQSIRRLDKLARYFMKHRMFALEDLCQKGIDFYMKNLLPKCRTCGYQDYFTMNFHTSSDECRWCYRDRMDSEYRLTKGESS